jgi:hypothetical protein
MKLLIALILMLPCIVLANETRGIAEAAGRQFLRCGGWSCWVTVMEVKGIDTRDAWGPGPNHPAQRRARLQEDRWFSEVHC